MSARHTTRIFRVESKKYRIKIDDLSYGGAILITEMTRNRFFHLSLDMECVGWLVKQMQDLLGKTEQTSFRRFRGDSYQVWMETFRNKNGCILSMTKNIHGATKTVLIPQGRDEEGWRMIKQNLSAILPGASNGDSEGNPRSPVCKGIRDNTGTLNKTYKEAVQSVSAAGEKNKEREKMEDNSK